MEVIQEFIKVGRNVRTITRIDETFNGWVTEVRRMQKEIGLDNLKNASMKDLHRYYDNLFLPEQVIQILR